NVTLIKGWFSDTLPEFLAQNSGEVDFVHIDCDLYSSTVDVFSILERRGCIKPGMILVFDELINYSRYLFNEMLALFEMLERTGFGIQWLGCHDKVRSIEETVGFIERDSHPSWKSDLSAG